MSHDNLIEVLDHYVNRRPFEPFTLILQDSSSCEIDNPKAIGYRSNSAIYFITPGGKPMVFDHESILKVYDGLASEIANELTQQPH